MHPCALNLPPPSLPPSTSLPLPLSPPCVQAYAFQGYWEDIGTIDAFFNANLALVNTDGKANFSFYDKDAPIYTMSRFLPPSKIMDSEFGGGGRTLLGEGSMKAPSPCRLLCVSTSVLEPS